MAKKFVGVILGIVIGIIVVSIVERAGHFLFPPTEEIDFGEPDSLVRFMESLPTGALVCVLAAHGLGSFLGSFSIFYLVKEKWWTGPLVVGMLLNVGGIINLVLLPHPQWFVISDLLLYVPMAMVGGWVGATVLGHTTNAQSVSPKTEDKN